MKAIFPILTLAAVALTGCSQSVAVRSNSGKHVAYVSRPDYFYDRVTITGSHIPTPRDQVTISPVFASTPSQSFSREIPSLYPTEPVVGVSPNKESATLPVNTGAGPAGSAPVLPIH